MQKYIFVKKAEWHFKNKTVICRKSQIVHGQICLNTEFDFLLRNILIKEVRRRSKFQAIRSFIDVKITICTTRLRILVFYYEASQNSSFSCTDFEVERSPK